MSVGGRVVETIDCGDKVWVNTMEPPNGRECAIYVERTAESRSISVGDGLWWQGSHAMWTPQPAKARPFTDRKLNRLGCSGVARPVHCGGCDGRCYSKLDGSTILCTVCGGSGVAP